MYVEAYMRKNTWFRNAISLSQFQLQAQTDSTSENGNFNA